MPVHKDMTIFEILQLHPQASEVLKKHGMSCGGCMGIMEESIEKGAQKHGKDLTVIINELNDILEKA